MIKSEAEAVEPGGEAPESHGVEMKESEIEIEEAVVPSPGTGMKITVAKDELVAKLGVVSRAVSSRGTVQVLSGILLTAEGGTLSLAATDMEVSLRTTLDAQVEGDGAVVIPGKLLVDLARLLPESEVKLEYRPDEGVAHIASGTASYRLNTYAAEDFPRLPAIEAQLHAIDREALLDTIGRVARSASRDESRPVLTGILVRFEAGKLVMVATDSYRLSVKETDLGGDAPELEAIIPARALQELSRLAGGAETIELGVHENHVVFGTGDAWLTTRRIDGQFPNYRQLLPETFEVELTVARAELGDVVRRVSVMAQRNSPLRLRFAEGELTVSAQTQDVGEAKESLPVPYTGEEFVIGFNADFLRDGVDSILGDDVLVKLINPLRPAILVDPAGDFTYLIMPIRLAG
ncbi:MAG TPA: DNA polymerase III subunit beta [Gaiellaceae bacterium]|nr:DNA polymerase III subunit beta [Gaiellaceae bacterium]